MAKSGRSDSDVESDDDNISNGAANSLAKPIKITTPISILIESLVKNLCDVYEQDKKNSKALYELICGKLFEMKLIDESYKMVEFEGMRGQYGRAFLQLLMKASGGKQPIHAFSLNAEIASDWSHYYREFEEIDYIAGGGFGQVFKVKHKLDGTHYAVKKIFIRSDGIEAVRNYLTEVKTFASLNHANIVQYKAAWLELGAPTANNVIETGASNDSYTYESVLATRKTRDDYIYPHAITEEESSLIRRSNCENTDFQIVFVSKDYEENHQHSYTTQYDLPKKNGREKRSSISEGGNAICTVDEIERIRVHGQHHPKWATLYIQMALCQSTLKQWLDKRNISVHRVDDTIGNALVPIGLLELNDNNERVLEILKQLLSGLEYIHSRKIVHHDIKPSNIFVQVENSHFLVQLGDFGLACPLQSARHSLAFGTKLYAAPEQLLGKCDPKSDMFSLGIVLLELVSTFKTDMERVQRIKELRQGNLSEDDIKAPSNLASVILELVSKNPKDRPDAKTLLQRLTNNDLVESDQVKLLRSQLAMKEEEINRLRELLKQAGMNNDS